MATVPADGARGGQYNTLGPGQTAKSTVLADQGGSRHYLRARAD